VEPKRLSASAIEAFEKCPANFNAKMIARAPEIRGAAADRGVVVHAALETFVAEGHYKATGNLKTLEDICRSEYVEVFSDNSELKACLDLCRRWFSHQDWTGREVLSTESKEFFSIPYEYMVEGELMKAEMEFTYIWDRCDRLDNGAIDVIDYKTVTRPITADDMRARIQPRLYGLAAQLKYPNAERIWVTYDLLRYEPVGVVFTKDDNRETYRYLQSVCRRVRESDGSEESLNENCRWCVRGATCETLQANISAGGILSVGSVGEAAELRMRLDAQRGGVSALIDNLDSYLLEEMERQDAVDLQTDTAQIKMTAQGRRKVDAQAVVETVGADIAAHYGNLTVEAVEQMLADEDLTEEQMSQVRQAIKKQFGSARIKVIPLALPESE
jgi:RecB family exonuclease